MTRSILEYVRQHAIAVVALVCSILAMAGSSYAAFTISGSQIVNHTIAPSKFDPKFINGSVRAWAVVDAKGRVVAGVGGPQVRGLLGNWRIKWWGVTLPARHCGTSATIIEPPPGLEPFTTAFVAASTQIFRVHGRPDNLTFVQTFNQSGLTIPLGFNVAVIC